MDEQPQEAGLLIEPTGIRCVGDWTQRGIRSLIASGEKALTQKTWGRVAIQADDIDAMDSSGAWLLQRFVAFFKRQGTPVSLESIKPSHQALFKMAQEKADIITTPLPKIPLPNWCYRVGKASIEKVKQFDGFLVLLGELSLYCSRAFRRFRLFQWPGIATTLEQNGYEALPIIALLSFLIGIVLSYQFGLELRVYGANVFIVNVTGLAILREFAPLVTAVILSGRTAAAFTAHIGTMKVNAEIDALKTMGISPTQRIILPRILGVVLVMPLLTVWAMIFGTAGSMLISKNLLGINYTDFLNRFQTEIPLKTYYVGLSKAPVFGLIVAIVGCYQGLNVAFSAESVGRRTTHAVVQSIFLLIVADACFSIIFNWMGI